MRWVHCQGQAIAVRQQFAWLLLPSPELGIQDERFAGRSDRVSWDRELLDWMSTGSMLSRDMCANIQCSLGHDLLPSIYWLVAE